MTSAMFDEMGKCSFRGVLMSWLMGAWMMMMLYGLDANIVYWVCVFFYERSKNSFYVVIVMGIRYVYI